MITAERYIGLYIRYAQWYNSVLHCSTEKQKIHLLQQRYIIWEDLLQEAPHPKQSTTSWQELIARWYEIRCRVVHGEPVPHSQIIICYDSLTIFMNEINRREALFSTCSEQAREIYLENPRAVDMISAKSLEKLFTNP